MRKILFITLMFFVVTDVFARCGRFDTSNCPTTVCPMGSFMGDDGKCYDCDIDASIAANCIGYKKAFEICPNRFFGPGCGTYSKLKCFDETRIKEVMGEERWGKKFLLHSGRYMWIDYTTHRCKSETRY
jgi:hypothetical protein